MSLPSSKFEQAPHPVPAGGQTARPSRNLGADTRSRTAQLITYIVGVRVELLLIGALFLATGAFGRSFSKLELGLSWLHPTEVLLGLALAIGLLRTPPAEWFARLRASRAVIPLGVLWIFGAIAAVRGLRDWGFSLVLHDIGLVEYSILIPLVAIVVRDRGDLWWLCRMVAFSGALAMLVYALTRWTLLQWGLSDALTLIAPATGLFITVYLAWVLARAAAGLPVSKWAYASVALGVAFVVMGLARAAWIGCLAAVAVAVLLARPGHRIALGTLAIGLIGIGVAFSIPANKVSFGEPPATSTAASSGTDDSLDSGSGGPGAGNAVDELSSSFRSSSQSTNSSWRLAFWSDLIEQTSKQPLFGVGFGRPSAVTWNGISYDRRTGDPADPFDVSGPHNSFVNVLYRTGVFGLLAVVSLMGIAGFGLVRRARSAQGEPRALVIWLLGGLAAATAVACFTVALEGPFMGIYFWGLLALALLAPGLLETDSVDHRLQVRNQLAS